MTLAGSGRTFRTVALIGLLAGGGTGPAGATDYIWPIDKWPLGTSTSTGPDEMNTSFGPRVNNSKWDFHDGIDLPGDCGTDVYAVAAGTIESADDKNVGNWQSRHVVIKVNDSSRGDVYVVYLHLEEISVAVKDALADHTQLPQGALVGKLGMDGNASYCHLHLEFRQGDSNESSSRHPLGYLPYTNTANFRAPEGARFNRQKDGLMAVRLIFRAGSKLEGDLARVEVELKHGTLSLETHKVDFDDKATIHEGNDDALEFTGDIAVEGYQSSDMVSDDRKDLFYGVVVRNLRSDCDNLVARVYDLGNQHVATSAPISVPDQVAVEQSLDFENGSVATPDWQVFASPGTLIVNYLGFGHGGSTHSLFAGDDSGLAASQQAAIESNLASDRFEWLAEAWIAPRELELQELGKQVYLLHFLDVGGANLSVAARLRRVEGSIRAGIVARQPNGRNTCKDSEEKIEADMAWHRWTLHLLRVGTRETAAVLLLDDEERARLSWDSTGYEPLKVRVGVGQSFPKVKAVVYVDDVLTTERTM